ncbi:short-chain dehydrogenase [Penicillium odoratum]|uniref:short-chain dehydrogenase n=1 Tax=Penicillium odoratum TaxID=1167516 RepID=UPI0025474DA0|nr:short-chain dehydrogenase [Penicillium odoratum]KAJ5768884.1 short-chain dehydrogenase [Penicillium odoratum]
MEYFRTVCPPAPTFTEKNVPDQSGKVFIVTGANSGVGAELAKILYGQNATVYIGARSKEKAMDAIEEIKTAHPDSTGRLVFLQLDLSDLTTIQRSADEFLAAESRLDVLWLNAGVMMPPQGSKTKQGYELQLGTNNLGHFLFVKYLHDILKKTALTAPKASVRVIWVSSSAILMAPKPAIDFDNMDYHQEESAMKKYARSKAGNVIHCAEYAKRTAGDGVLSLCLNPGNLKSGLQRHMSRVQGFLTNLILYPAINGAYTELYAGLSADITEEQNASFVAPWGRVIPIRQDLYDPELTKKYWEWSEEQVQGY